MAFCVTKYLDESVLFSFADCVLYIIPSPTWLRIIISLKCNMHLFRSIITYMVGRQLQIDPIFLQKQTIVSSPPPHRIVLDRLIVSPCTRAYPFHKTALAAQDSEKEQFCAPAFRSVSSRLAQGPIIVNTTKSHLQENHYYNFISFSQNSISR